MCTFCAGVTVINIFDQDSGWLAQGYSQITASNAANQTTPPPGSYGATWSAVSQEYIKGWSTGYTAGLSCTWHLVAIPGTTLTINLRSLDTERDRDVLSIRRQEDESWAWQWSGFGSEVQEPVKRITAGPSGDQKAVTACAADFVHKLDLPDC